MTLFPVSFKWVFEIQERRAHVVIQIAGAKLNLFSTICFLNISMSEPQMRATAKKKAEREHTYVGHICSNIQNLISQSYRIRKLRDVIRNFPQPSILNSNHFGMSLCMTLSCRSL